jgi:hypothetical protein
VLSPAGMAVERQHLEVVVELAPGGDPVAVSAWLHQHGLSALPLTVGLLASGEADTFRAAFRAEPSGALPIPKKLAQHVAAITVVPPKQMHGGE